MKLISGAWEFYCLPCYVDIYHLMMIMLAPYIQRFSCSGTVYSTVKMKTGLEVVIKQINLTEEIRKELITKLSVLQEKKHLNIVNCLDSYLVGDELWVIMEYLAVGCLTGIINKHCFYENEISAVCREAILDYVQKYPKNETKGHL
ncbi:serine/threonine-protein kinase PAK 3-like isoform X2 [Tachypleus tridentatus]|uniref:serine/threonine-protein kinase PAK 3-like isoform X2 n=1 Tax=Tachypleus tridentatus TaxID=6853 RepID=UPI003FD6BFB1